MKIKIINTFDKRMVNLPMIISFPRSGWHYLRGLLELYFDRPGLRHGKQTFISRNRTDYMWFHDHDIGLLLPDLGPVLYLWREPVDVISSYHWCEAGAKFDDELIEQLMFLYKQHLQKYNITENTVITYEELKKKPVETFKKVCSYFSTELDVERFNRILPLVTKEAMIERTQDRKYYDWFLLSEEYRRYKDNFKSKYANKINKYFDKE